MLFLSTDSIIISNCEYVFDFMSEDVKRVALRGSVQNVGRRTRDQITTLIISAFGLVAALAWNTAIQGIFTVVFGARSDIGAMLGYAVTVTIIAVVVTVYLSRITEKA